MSGRPTPRRGDWIESKGANTSIVLKFYSAPPGHGGGDDIDVPTHVGPHQYLGPVHDVDDSKHFVSASLPHPTTGELAWMNIWSTRRGPDTLVVCITRLSPQIGGWRRGCVKDSGTSTRINVRTGGEQNYVD